MINNSCLPIRLPVFLALLLLAAAPASASTLQLTIQPIQVCSDAGTSCANPGLELFAAVDNKIWAQADIWFEFLGWTTLNATSVLDATFDWITSEGHGQNPDLDVINVWFVDEILDCGGVSGAYGCGYLNDNGVAIANSVFSANRIDSLAHELGHNLGLGHTSVAAELMASGGVRAVPGSIDDVYPRGDLASQLTAAQIETARGSQFLSAVPTADGDSPVPVPEPGSLLLVGLGLAAAARRVRLPSPH